MNEPKSEILIVAAEASSELYARRILEEVAQKNLPYKFFGVGSRQMEQLGCELVENSEKMAVVGLWEVLSHWGVISGAFKRLVELARTRKPAMALLLDYPDFNLRLAKKLRKLGIPVVYYISPQVWAWRTKRVFLIQKIVSRMLVVFPFEKDFYQKYRVPVEFVGHPLLDELSTRMLNSEKRKEGRGHWGIKDGDFLVGLLPGSRDSELKYNLATQVKAAEIIAAQRPQARFLMLVAPSLEVETVRNLLPPSMKVPIILVKDEPLKVMQLCDCGLVASGTATLMMSLAETPMVIMYKMNALTGWLAPYLVKGRIFGMANLILGEKAVPELFQREASPEKLAAEIIRFIDNPDYHRWVKAKLSQARSRLGHGGVASRVVEIMGELVAT